MFLVMSTHVIGRVFQPLYELVMVHDVVWPILVPFFRYSPYVMFGVLVVYCCRYVVMLQICPFVVVLKSEPHRYSDQ